MTTPIDLSSASIEQLEAVLAIKKQGIEKNREAYKSLVAETLPKAVVELIVVSQQLQEIKTSTFKYFKNILMLKAEVFGTKENQQTHTFSDDKYSLTLGYRVNEGWDDTATAGIEKVTNFIQSLAKDKDTAALVTTVFRLLKKDAKGNLRASRVLELQKLKDTFNNSEFNDGVDLIMKAYKPVKSCWFIEASVKNDKGETLPIPLSISTAGFTEEFDLWA